MKKEEQIIEENAILYNFLDERKLKFLEIWQEVKRIMEDVFSINYCFRN
jgi:hypothetical protein